MSSTASSRRGSTGSSGTTRSSVAARRPPPAAKRRVVVAKAAPAPPPPTPVDDRPVEQAAPHYVRAMLREYFAERGFRRPDKEALRFMRAHASIVMVMPATPVIERLALETQVGESLDRDPSAANAARLAALHHTPRRTLSKMFKRASGGVGLAAHRALAAAVEHHCRQHRHNRFTRRVRVGPSPRLVL